jgi:hypothetical protein
MSDLQYSMVLSRSHEKRRTGAQKILVGIIILVVRNYCASEFIRHLFEALVLTTGRSVLSMPRDF